MNIPIPIVIIISFGVILFFYSYFQNKKKETEILKQKKDKIKRLQLEIIFITEKKINKLLKELDTESRIIKNSIRATNEEILNEIYGFRGDELTDYLYESGEIDSPLVKDLEANCQDVDKLIYPEFSALRIYGAKEIIVKYTEAIRYHIDNIFNNDDNIPMINNKIKLHNLKAEERYQERLSSYHRGCQLSTKYYKLLDSEICDDYIKYSEFEIRNHIKTVYGNSKDSDRVFKEIAKLDENICHFYTLIKGHSSKIYIQNFHNLLENYDPVRYKLHKETYYDIGQEISCGLLKSYSQNEIDYIKSQILIKNEINYEYCDFRKILKPADKEYERNELEIIVPFIK